ncbi:hypothetical protein AAG906_017857 [Vitis piasezkii]
MKKWADKKRRHTEYKVGDMVGKVSYKMELPPRLKIHLSSTGHLLVTSYDKEVEHIIATESSRRGVPPTTEYLVKWKGLPSEARREPANALWRFQGGMSQDASNDPPMAYIGSEKLLETLGDIHT